MCSRLTWDVPAVEVAGALWFSIFFSRNTVSRDRQSDKHRSEIVTGIITPRGHQCIGMKYQLSAHKTVYEKNYANSVPNCEETHKTCGASPQGISGGP